MKNCRFSAYFLLLLTSSLLHAEDAYENPYPGPTSAITWRPDESEDSSKFDFEFNVEYESMYVRRGVPVVFNSPVVQPSAFATYKHFSFMVWTNFDTTNKPAAVYPSHQDTAGELTEVDYSLEYNFEKDKWTVVPGFMYLEFPHTGVRSTYRGYITLAYDNWITPRFFFLYDFKTVRGWESTLYLGHTFKDIWKSDWLSVSVYFGGETSIRSSNFCQAVYGVHKFAWTDGALDTDLIFQFNKHFIFAAFARATTLIDHAIVVSQKHPQLFWYGCTLTYNWK